MTFKQILMMGLLACSPFMARAQHDSATPYDRYPTPQQSLTEMTYAPQRTEFRLWSPMAEAVTLRLYRTGTGGKASKTISLRRATDGTWSTQVRGNLDGLFYTFEVKTEGRWRGESPGINARAVGINGERAAILNLDDTDPEGWENDRAPKRSDIVIYEMHHRDFSVHPSSGIHNKGKFLALTEHGTHTPDGQATGLDHLKMLGVTHIHILPSYDYGSVDEREAHRPHYNWGYDPVNYNVPEGSYALDPSDPKSRIREFKQMVQALHRNGLKVVLDVVYNHTYDLERSNFERTVPGYFYRHRPDGTPANGSGCGNETASERAVMRQYMVESVEYWMREYHIDGFRFDLMGIHDIETMRQIRAAAERINPDVLIYGEGWAAEAPQLPSDRLAMKANVGRIPGVAAFCDELRDALRGPFSDDHQAAFLAGLPGHEESIKFGIVGGIRHPQIDLKEVNYSHAPWAEQPHQLISYVSCHDDMCLQDRLHASIPGLSDADARQIALVAQTAVFTSQGIPFMLAGEELVRTKLGVHNSFNSPDSINQIDWSTKAAHAADFDYYRALIRMRRDHPAFRLGDADLVRRHLEFLPAPSAMVAYRLKDHAGGDPWRDIIVVLNGAATDAQFVLPTGSYTLHLSSNEVRFQQLNLNPETLSGTIHLPARSAAILYAGE